LSAGAVEDTFWHTTAGDDDSFIANPGWTATGGNAASAIDDDGYIILPSDTQGLIHAATLSPDTVNELLSGIAQYVADGAQAVITQAHLNADGNVDVPEEEIRDVVITVTKMQAAAQVLAAAANAVITQLYVRPEPTGGNDQTPETAILFPAGYPIAYIKVDPGGITAVSYVTDLDLVSEPIRRGAVDGTYEFYRAAENGTPVFMTPDEVVGTLPEA